MTSEIQNSTSNTEMQEKLYIEVSSILGQAGDFDDYQNLDENWKKIGTFQLDPSECGPVAAMFLTLEATVKVSIAEGVGHIRIEYKFDHPNGSQNGYSAQFQIQD